MIIFLFFEIMSSKTNGPILQIDRLIIDPKNPIKPKSVRSDVSPSSTIRSFLNQSSEESHFFFPSNQIKIIRLTLEDLHNNKSVSNLVRSPIYESIDEKQRNIK
ncbi:hypothetical protein I4U23_017391 [Adineta vaga]|nr:hypothetical protein I4U23_017391 [Adineta vaga]